MVKIQKCNNKLCNKKMDEDFEFCSAECFVYETRERQKLGIKPVNRCGKCLGTEHYDLGSMKCDNCDYDKPNRREDYAAVGYDRVKKWVWVDV